MSTKVRKTLSLDADLIAEIGAQSDNLSAVVNAMLRDALARRTRQAALGEWLAELDTMIGPSDPDLLTRYEALLADDSAAGSPSRGPGDQPIAA